MKVTSCVVYLIEALVTKFDFTSSRPMGKHKETFCVMLYTQHNYCERAQRHGSARARDFTCSWKFR